MSFHKKLNNAIEKNNSLLCIGLDTDIQKIPQHLLALENPLLEFNKKIIDHTADLVCSYKPNIAFYASQGLPGLKALIQTIAYIHAKYSQIPVILDAKRADIGSTAKNYAQEAFDVYLADAVTVIPYLGFDGLEPFLEHADKGIIILCKTSNESASDFQDLMVEGKPLYIAVAEKVAAWNKKYKNCLLVVGATYPEELKMVREIVQDMFILVPGIGTQGGDLEQTLKNGLNKNNSGLIINSSRAILYASQGENFAKKAREEAEKLKNQINSYR